MLYQKTIAVIVPAYNEEALIYRTVSTLPDFVDKIIVVDDASTDRTEDILVGMVLEIDRLEVIRHDRNRGVGAAIASGYKLARATCMDIAVVMAGDGQMDVGDLEKIIEPVASGEADYSKGNRFIIPHWKYMGNLILSFLTRLLTGYRVGDTQSGYTAINLDTLKRLNLDSIYPRYGMPNDMLFKLSKLGAEVKDVYTTPIYHIGEKTGIRLKEVVPKISWLFMRGLWQRLGHSRRIGIF